MAAKLRVLAGAKKNTTFAPIFIPRIMKLDEKLLQRSDNKCELCQSATGLKIYEVPPKSGNDEAYCLLICDNCRAQIDRKAELDSAHWRRLSDTIWSEVPGIKVVSWR